VARQQERKFLGFSFTAGPGIKRTIAPKSLERFKQRIREITRKAKGVSIKTTMEELATYMRGWRGYFGFCETPEVLIVKRHPELPPLRHAELPPPSGS
jgi:RNA-directed DNA polymerase